MYKAIIAFVLAFSIISCKQQTTELTLSLSNLASAKSNGDSTIIFLVRDRTNSCSYNPNPHSRRTGKPEKLKVAFYYRHDKSKRLGKPFTLDNSKTWYKVPVRCKSRTWVCFGAWKCKKSWGCGKKCKTYCKKCCILCYNRYYHLDFI